MSAPAKVTIEEHKLPDGSIQQIEVTKTTHRVKKAVFDRSQLAPFGAVAHEAAKSVTGIEKPIEIRPLPPTTAQSQNQPIDDAQGLSDQFFDQIQTAPRCKLCGMEGHFSLKCPKRKEIEVVPTKGDEVKEITILVTDISTMVTESEFNAFISEHRYNINARHDRDHSYIPVKTLKSSMPKDKDGNSRGIAYINLLSTPSNEIFAQELVDLVDGGKLGMMVLSAAIQADRGGRGKKAPNRYDDEEKWGASASRFQ